MPLFRRLPLLFFLKKMIHNTFSSGLTGSIQLDFFDSIFISLFCAPLCCTFRIVSTLGSVKVMETLLTYSTFMF